MLPIPRIGGPTCATASQEGDLGCVLDVGRKRFLILVQIYNKCPLK